MNSTRRLLKLAIALGATPLFAGALVYGAWFFTRWQWLEISGLLLIGIGLVAFFAGAIALMRYGWLESRNPRGKRTTFWLKCVLTGGLLFANFPAAAFFTISTIEIKTRYTVRLFNDSSQPVESLRVTGGGITVEMGPIPSGRQVEKHLHFREDGSLDFEAHQQERWFTGVIEPYVWKGMEGARTIRIHKGGQYEVSAE